MNTRQSLEIERQRLTERFEEQPEGRVFAPLADCHRKLGNLDEALDLCLRGLERHPAYSSAYVILGKIHLDRGDAAAGRLAFEKVLELDGQNLLALRQLAELDEVAGDLDGAEHRWNQVALIELDPAYAEHRLEQLHALRSAPAPEVGDARPVAEVEHDAAEATTTPVVTPHPAEATAWGDLEPAASAQDLGEISADQTVPAARVEPASPRPERRSAVPTAEIATMTLAEIYAEQGFKAKALEIYRQIYARNPSVSSLGERIAALEAESVVPAPRRAPAHDPRLAPQSQPEDAYLEELEEPVSADLAPGARAHDAAADTEPRAVPSAPLEAPVVARDEEIQERERYTHFRTWLDRIRVDEN